MPDATKPEGDSSGDSPKYLTPDEAKALISETVNRALSSHIGRALTPAKLKTAVREVMAEQAIEKEKDRDGADQPEAGAKDNEAESSAEGAPGKPVEGEPQRRPPTRAAPARRSPEEEPQRPVGARSDSPPEGVPNTEVEGLKKKISELEGNWRKAQKQAEQERQHAIEQKGYGDLRAVLGTKVRPDAVSVVTDVLRSRGMVVFDDEGQVRLKVHASLAKGEPEDDHIFDLEAGLGYFLGTKEGALFVPPPSPGAGAPRRPARELTTQRPTPSHVARSTGDKLAELEERTGRNLDELL